LSYIFFGCAGQFSSPSDSKMRKITAIKAEEIKHQAKIHM
jgi:hypothetical protein